jgi:hypothetical protein
MFFFRTAANGPGFDPNAGEPCFIHRLHLGLEQARQVLRSDPAAAPAIV